MWDNLAFWGSCGIKIRYAWRRAVAKGLFIELIPVRVDVVQESLPIAKTTARCAQYMGALKSFESPRKRPRLLFPKFVKGFCSDRH